MQLKTKPAAWEDHNVYINIYKSGLENEARNKAIWLRELALEQEPPEPTAVEWAGWWWVAQQLWASMLAWEASQWSNPSIQDVSA